MSYFVGGSTKFFVGGSYKYDWRNADGSQQVVCLPIKPTSPSPSRQLEPSFSAESESRRVEDDEGEAGDGAWRRLLGVDHGRGAHSQGLQGIS